MPGGNRMGPAGQGPRTGRGAGFCGGNQAPGSETIGQPTSGGRGRGGGRRGQGGRARRGQGGRGQRNRFQATGLAGQQRVTAEQRIIDEPDGSDSEAQTAEHAQTAVRGEAAVEVGDLGPEIFRVLQDIQSRLAVLEGDGETDSPIESSSVSPPHRSAN